MKTKIRLNIPPLDPAHESKLVIYDEPRNILFSSNISSNEIDADLPFETAAWFNIWIFAHGGWSVAFGGVPQIVSIQKDEMILEISTTPKSHTSVKKTPQITAHDAEFVNGILGDKSVSPTLPQMAKSLGSAVAGWAKAGFAMASAETLASRLSICGACDLWDPTAFGGTGRCSKCGCSTQAKLRMATSSCPLDPPKW